MQNTLPLDESRAEHEASIKKIDDLDLSMVKMKLCLPLEKEGKGWTQEEAVTAELWYKRFLTLCAIYPHEDIVPTHQIDAIWHAHILDTRAYIADCQEIFGGYLHHFPYFGLRDEQDAQDLADSFQITCERFIRHFGESPLVTVASKCGQSDGGGTGCSRKIHASKCGQQDGGGTGCSRK